MTFLEIEIVAFEFMLCFPDYARSLRDTYTLHVTQKIPVVKHNAVHSRLLSNNFRRKTNLAGFRFKLKGSNVQIMITIICFSSKQLKAVFVPNSSANTVMDKWKCLKTRSKNSQHFQDDLVKLLL